MVYAYAIYEYNSYVWRQAELDSKRLKEEAERKKQEEEDRKVAV